MWRYQTTEDCVVLQAGVRDSGFYSCVAGNILGESVSTAYLEINQAGLVVGGSWVVVVASILLQCSHHINSARLLSENRRTL